MADLIRQGKGPLEVRSISRSIVDLPNGAAMFNVTLKNHANTTISMFNAVAVLFDGEGKPADPPTAESGWAELGGISADSEVQLSMALPGKGVARMRLVLKDLVYEAPNPLGKNMGTLGMKWNNKAWQDEVAKAKP